MKKMYVYTCKPPAELKDITHISDPLYIFSDDEMIVVKLSRRKLKSKYVTQFFYHASVDSMIKIHNTLCKFHCGIKMGDKTKREYIKKTVESKRMKSLNTTIKPSKSISKNTVKNSTQNAAKSIVINEYEKTHYFNKYYTSIFTLQMLADDEIIFL